MFSNNVEISSPSSGSSSNERWRSNCVAAAGASLIQQLAAKHYNATLWLNIDSHSRTHRASLHQRRHFGSLNKMNFCVSWMNKLIIKFQNSCYTELLQKFCCWCCAKSSKFYIFIYTLYLSFNWRMLMDYENGIK